MGLIQGRPPRGVIKWFRGVLGRFRGIPGLAQGHFLGVFLGAKIASKSTARPKKFRMLGLPPQTPLPDSEQLAGAELQVPGSAQHTGGVGPRVAGPPRVVLWAVLTASG